MLVQIIPTALLILYLEELRRILRTTWSLRYTPQEKQLTLESTYDEQDVPELEEQAMAARDADTLVDSLSMLLITQDIEDHTVQTNI